MTSGKPKKSKKKKSKHSKKSKPEAVEQKSNDNNVALNEADEQTNQDLTEFVQNLLTKMHERFQEMSDSIIGRRYVYFSFVKSGFDSCRSPESLPS